MVLNTHQGSVLALSWRVIGLAIVFALVLVGCAASEETTEGADTAGSSDQQALTSFVGDARPEVGQASQESAQAATEALLEDLRTENTGLKQKLMKMEQDSRSLSVRLSETEARLLAEKERAEKAETTARSLAQPTARVAMTPRMGEPTEASLAAYQQALASFKSKKYDDAISQLQALLNSGVSVELADNCNYWIGESYFGKRSYREALPHFEKVLAFDRSPKLADAHYMIGQTYERLGDKARAKASYEKVINDFPVSGNVKRAKERAAKL